MIFQHLADFVTDALALIANRVTSLARPVGCARTGRVQAVSRLVDAIGQAASHFSEPAALGGVTCRLRTRARGVIVARYVKPQQACRCQQRGHRIRLDGVANVLRELLATAFSRFYGAIDQFTGQKFVTESIDEVADLCALLIGLALEAVQVFLR